MNSLTAQQLLQTLIERLTTAASVRNVYGEPIVSGQKTIIPVAKVKLGFGGGFGEGKAPRRKTPIDELESGHGEGGGGGGGLVVQPIGVIEITPERTHYLPINNRRSIVVGVAIGLVLGGVLRRRRR